MAAHPDRYSGFVEDDRGLDDHLRCMRMPGTSTPLILPCVWCLCFDQGTYGGHLELSAFAHLMKINVKVIQPGLVYVIEWNTAGPEGAGSGHEDDAREARRTRRDQVRESKAPKQERTVYVACVSSLTTDVV